MGLGKHLLWLYHGISWFKFGFRIFSSYSAFALTAWDHHTEDYIGYWTWILSDF